MVAEMLGMSCGQSASSRRSSVDLPTPEGPEMTTSCPGASLILSLYPTAGAVEKWGSGSKGRIASIGVSSRLTRCWLPARGFARSAT